MFAWKADVHALEVDGAMVSEQAFKLTLLSLAEHAGASGHCWPSVKRMAKHTGLGESTVRRACRGLEAQGLLRRELTNGKGARYFLPLGDNSEDDLDRAHSERAPAQPERATAHSEQPARSLVSNRTVIESLTEPVKEPALPMSAATGKPRVAAARAAMKPRPPATVTKIRQSS
jgi:DNA-binding transcriptional regulator YhcF (GntR family)